MTAREEGAQKALLEAFYFSCGSIEGDLFPGGSDTFHLLCQTSFDRFLCNVKSCWYKPEANIDFWDCPSLWEVKALECRMGKVGVVLTSEVSTPWPCRVGTMAARKNPFSVNS